MTHPRGSYPPIYADQRGRYRADTCAPLSDAVERGEIELHAIARGHYPGRRLEKSELPGVKTVGYWDAPRLQNWGLPWHRNEGVEITYCGTGHIGFAVDSFACTLSEGDFTITKPWQLHRVGNPHVAAGRLYWVILDVGIRRPNQAWCWPRWLALSHRDLEELAELMRGNERCVWPAASLGACFSRIAKAVTLEPMHQVTSRVAVALNDLLLQLLDLLRDSSAAGERTVSDSCLAVDLFLNDLSHNLVAMARDWSVEQMAAACGLGKTQFVRYCRQLTNLSPANYLRQCRLELAARWLRERPTMSITEIALDCGFSSSQYFATAFQRHFARSPRGYREATPEIPDIVDSE